MLSPVQAGVMHQARESIPSMPDELLNIISAYAFGSTDIRWSAGLEPGSGMWDQVLEVLANRDCSPALKRSVIESAVQCGEQASLNKMLDQIRNKGLKIDLDGVDFSGINLSNLDFSEASLVSASFRNNRMQDTRFSRADLHGAYFADCQMENVHFRHANLHKATMTNGHMLAVDLEQADIDRMIFENVRLESTSLEPATTSNQGLLSFFSVLRNLTSPATYPVPFNCHLSTGINTVYFV